MRDYSPKRAVGFALTSAALFGVSVPVAKLLLGDGIEARLLAGLLYLGSGIGLAAVLAMWRAMGLRSAEAPLRWSDAPRLIAVIAVGGVAGPLLLLWGLAHTDAASASLLLNVEGVATLCIAWLVFHENADGRIVLGAFAILAGAAIVSWGGGIGSFNIGALAIVGACLAWAVDNNLTRGLSGSNPIEIAAWKGVSAGTFNVLLAVFFGVHLPAPGLLAAAGALGVVSYGASLALFVLALRHLGVARTGAYFSTAPFIGAFVAMILFDEPFTLRLAISAALMGLGLLLHILEVHAHRHRHQPLEHNHSHNHDAHHKHSHETGTGEQHAHEHRHDPTVHSHPHYPDLHHRHSHAKH
jgi:drug/metabolite transporter (DMT)-like permease